MTPQVLFDLAMGPFGAFMLLCIFVIALVSGKWVVPYFVYIKEVERVVRLDEQVDASTELLRKIITNQEMSDERDRVRREQDRERGG